MKQIEQQPFAQKFSNKIFIQCCSEHASIFMYDIFLATLKDVSELFQCHKLSAGFNV